MIPPEDPGLDHLGARKRSLASSEMDDDPTRVFLRLVRNLLGFMVVALGVLFAINALDLMPASPWDGILGIALGSVCIVSAQIVEARR